MKFYQTSIKEVVDYFQSKTNEGLTQEEANKRLARDGYNEFEKSKKKSFLEKFIAQFKSFMIIVLIVAAIISGVHIGLSPMFTCMLGAPVFFPTPS